VRASWLLVIALSGCSDAVADVIRAKQEPSPAFLQPQPWTTNVASDPVDPSSDAMIAALAAGGGWGTSNRFRIDFGAEVLLTTGDTPYRDFTPTSDFFDGCDRVPFPLPPGGALSGEDGYRCTTDGDCYLLVLDPPTRRLFEMYRADYDGTTFRGGCAVVWDLNKKYGPYLRGKGCSSADGGGLPIAPLLATADEVASGRIEHALHLALPNDRLRRGIYVSPASHSTGQTTAGADGIPYGARLRLKSSVDDGRFGANAAVLLRAMKEYGVYVASSGNVPLSVRGDRSTKHTWTNLGIDGATIEALAPSDFEVLALGTPVDWLADSTCHLEP
jgi:serine/threonine-protein kinase